MTKGDFDKLLTDGIEHCKLGSYEKGLYSFNLAAEYDTNEELLYNRSKALFRLRRLKEAMDDLNKLVELQPENPVWYAERAVIHHYNKDKEKALLELNKAIDLDPGNGFRFASRAFIKDFYGDHHGALSDYEKAIELDPEDAISFNNKGLVEEKLGNMEKAKASFANADRLDRKNRPLKPSQRPQHLDLKVSPSKPIARKMTLNHYFQTFREIVTSKSGARGFLNFVFGKK